MAKWLFCDSDMLAHRWPAVADDAAATVAAPSLFHLLLSRWGDQLDLFSALVCLFASCCILGENSHTFKT